MCMHRRGVEPCLAVVIFFTDADQTISGQCVYCTSSVLLHSLVIFVNCESVVCSNRGKKFLFSKKMLMPEIMDCWGFEPHSSV
jgi:hypothetical protein